MNRRDFIAGTAALLVSPRRSWAQGTPRRVGYLGGSRDGSIFKVWQESLRDRGWVDGKNVIIDYRYWEGHAERIPALAAELVALRPDLLVSSRPQATVALKSATATIPIVFVSVADPVGLGLVQSLSRPGGNITGLATMVPDDFLAKRIQILQDLAGASKIALLVNPSNQMHRLLGVEQSARIARNLGVALLIVEATTPEEIDAAFASAAAQHADAIVDVGDTLTILQAPRVIALAAKYHLPANYLYRLYANQGGLTVYGPDLADLFRRTAGYVDKILKGTKAADLPVEQPTKFELVINMKTAKALGLTVPPSILVRADEVIE
jgi:putative ABC transport system substrate-binding protein